MSKSKKYMSSSERQRLEKRRSFLLGSACGLGSLLTAYAASTVISEIPDLYGPAHHRISLIERLNAVRPNAVQLEFIKLMAQKADLLGFADTDHGIADLRAFSHHPSVSHALSAGGIEIHGIELNPDIQPKLDQDLGALTFDDVDMRPKLGVDRTLWSPGLADSYLRMFQRNILWAHDYLQFQAIDYRKWHHSMGGGLSGSSCGARGFYPKDDSGAAHHLISHNKKAAVTYGAAHLSKPSCPDGFGQIYEARGLEFRSLGMHLKYNRYIEKNQKYDADILIHGPFPAQYQYGIIAKTDETRNILAQAIANVMLERPDFTL